MVRISNFFSKLSDYLYNVLRSHIILSQSCFSAVQDRVADETYFTRVIMWQSTQQALSLSLYSLLFLHGRLELVTWTGKLAIKWLAIL